MSEKQIHFDPSSVLSHEYEGIAGNIKQTLQTLAVAAVSGVVEIDYSKRLLIQVLNLINDEKSAGDPVVREAIAYLQTGEFNHPDEVIANRLIEVKKSAPLAEKL